MDIDDNNDNNNDLTSPPLTPTDALTIIGKLDIFL